MSRSTNQIRFEPRPRIGVLTIRDRRNRVRE